MQISPLDRQPIEWANPQGANLYSTGASGPAAVRPPHAVNAVESTDKLGEGATARLQSMWRASAMAGEAAEQAQKTDQQERNMLQVRTQPLTYEEPKVKRTGGL